MARRPLFQSAVLCALSILCPVLSARADVVLIVDNDDGAPGYTEQGTWATSGVAGYDGGTYRYAAYGDPPSTATWTTTIEHGGIYSVSSHFLRSTNRTTDAPFTILHSAGRDLVHIDMTGTQAMTEAVFGEYLFTTGTLAVVSLGDNGAPGYSIADAVQFRMATDDPPEFPRLMVSPPHPRATDNARVLAEIRGDLAVTSITLLYSTSANPTPAAAPMFDDGLHDDGAADDAFYAAALPLQPAGTIVSGTIRAMNAAGQTAESPPFTYEVRDAALPPPRVFVLAGQSNASGRGALDENTVSPDPAVWMFGNDYRWKEAYEPVDDTADQVDAVSDDRVRIYPGSGIGHSLALRAAKDVRETSGTVYLIPCPLGGTRIAQWRRGADPFDRATLFGSMNFRRRLAAPEGVTALWWYQGESDSASATFRENHTALIGEIRAEMGAGLPVVYVQLAGHTNATSSARQHATGEFQRQLETGSGSAWELPAHFMVPAFDLPLGEAVHINQEAQIELGRRVALATREHVLGEALDGTGPRLIHDRPLIHPQGDRATIAVRFDRPVNEAVDAYDHQFRAYGAGTELAIAGVQRSAEDSSVVLISLTAPAPEPVTLSYGDRTMPGLNVRLNRVVKGTNDLPAPRFGPLPVVLEPADVPAWWAVR